MNNPGIPQNPPALPRVVGLTGGVGSGKSRVREMFSTLGVPTLDADAIARQIHQCPEHPAVGMIANRFPDLMSAEGQLQRGVLYRYFISRPEENKALRSILKPFVMAEMHAWTRCQKSNYVIWESALLLEEEISVDRILFVDTPEEQRLVFLRDRNAALSEAQIRRLMKIQMPRSDYLQHAHDVIMNHSTLERLQRRVSEIHREYNAQWPAK